MFFKKSLFARFVLMLALLVATVGRTSPKQVSAAPGDTTLVSLGSILSPLGANNGSYKPSISADGRYVAFYSSATNLISNDTNGKIDIFVFDRQTELAERVSVDSDGTQANGDSGFPSISVDGRYVAFVSDASNLVSNDTNGGKDIFLHDRQTGLTERISTVSPYTPGADSGYIPPSISGDGRYVAFGSAANAFVSGDMNGMEDIFVYDRQTGITERVSVGLDGAESNNHSYSPSMSVDGRYVTYDSWANNLVGEDTNGVGDTFVYDRQTGITERVSVDSSGVEANSHSSWPSISADGRYVAFGSDATNLVSGDMNGESDVFVHDRQTGVTERVSVSSSGAEGDWNSYAPAISADGRYVAFAAYASTLVSEDTNNAWDIFVHDRQADTTQRVSVSSSGGQGDSHSDWPSISGDGRYVTFTSAAENMVSTDLNYNNDIFIHDRQTSETEIVSVGPVGMGANQGSYDPSFSSDGRYVSFVSRASNFVGEDTNHKSDVFVYDRQSGVVERVSVHSSGAEAHDNSLAPVLSADGRYVAFNSPATDLVNDDTNRTYDVFLHDRQTGVTERVSVNSSGVQANSSSYSPSISADGRFVVFESYASNLVDGDTGVSDIFIRDRQTGLTQRISTAPGGMLPNNSSESASISADGRYVAFRSRASNLVPGDTNNTYDIFVYDRQQGVTERVSVDSGGVQANNASQSTSISGEGRYVTFSSDASNLVSGDTNGVRDIFVHDRQTGLTERVSVDSSGAQGNNASDAPFLSSDGRYVAFASNASNLVGSDTNNATDIFVHDREIGNTRRVSVDSSDVQANGNSNTPSITANGQLVAFASGATNLVNGDTNSAYDIFVHENTPQQPRTIYVDWNAEGVKNGTSWTDAYTDLQSALADASSGDEIWIASGTYLPTTGADRTISFVLKNGVAIYGGFAGSEAAREQRNPVVNVTILSGNIGLPETNSDNSYHVILINEADSTTVLDGFTVTGGNGGEGGGIYNSGGSPTLRDLTFSNNSASIGGGMYSQSGSPTLTNVTFHNNSASSAHGGGMYNSVSSPMLVNVTFVGNHAVRGGAIYNSASNPTLINITFSNNSVSSGNGGALFNYSNSRPTLTNVILWGNGSEVYNDSSTPTISHSVVQGGCPTQSTCLNIIGTDPLLGTLGNYGGNTQTIPLQPGSSAINTGNDATCPDTDQRGVTRPQGNQCDIGAYEFEPDSVPPTVASVTPAGENPTTAAGVDFTVTFSESVTDVDAGDFILKTTGSIVNAVVSGVSGTGSTRTITVNTGSGNGMLRLDVPIEATITDLAGNPLDDLPFVTGEAYTVKKPASVDVSIHGSLKGTYSIPPGGSIRKSFPGINNGPVNVFSTNQIPIMAAERVIYKVNGAPTSFSEMMGLPDKQLDTTYWLPWYNNVNLNTQLRFANVSNTEATIHVFIGKQEMPGSPFTLAPGGSTRKSFRGIDRGPVKIESNVKIVAAERVIHNVNGVDTSFSETMALPNSQLSTTYWLPWYNSKDLDTQLRFANVSDQPATIHVRIGGVEVTGSPFMLAPGISTRKSFPGHDRGPVKIESNVKIVAAERVIYKVNGLNTSFSEMMALPEHQLDSTYWLPWYNNVELDTQLRFANVSDASATVHVTIGGVEMPGSPFTLVPGASMRKSFPGVNKGPVKIESNADIVAAQRVIYKATGGLNTSFSEMMGLPSSQLDVIYWLPWYNNIELDTQLRFGIP